MIRSTNVLFILHCYYGMFCHIRKLKIRKHMLNIKITLIGTTFCHLCEEAELMVKQAMLSIEEINQMISLNKIDITTNDELYALYSQKIPVLLIENGMNKKVVYWPFNNEALICKILEIL